MSARKERGARARSLADALQKREAEERRLATSHLAELDPDEALPLLMRALGDSDWRVRKEATIAARQFMPGRALISALISALGSGENVGLRNAAVEVLASSGHAAAGPIADAMGSLDADGRKLAVETLGRSRDPAALGPLEAALFDQDDNVRQAAVEAIATVGSVVGEPAHKILLRCLGEDDRFVRLAALEGLNAMGVPVPWARLEPLLSDSTIRTAAFAAAALTEHPAAPAALAMALTTCRGGAFVQALTALAKLAQGPLTREVTDALQAHGRELDARVVRIAWGDGGEPDPMRAAALVVAAVMRAPGATEAAIGALADRTLAAAAQQAISMLGEAALPALIAQITPGAGPLEAKSAGAASDPPSPRSGWDASPLSMQEPPSLTNVWGQSTPPPRGSAEPGDDPPPAELRAAVIDAAASIILEGKDTSRTPPELLTALRAAALDKEKDVVTSALYALSKLGVEADLTLAAERSLSPTPAVASASESALAALAVRHVVAARALATDMIKREPFSLPAAIIFGALGTIGALDLGAIKDEMAFLAHCATCGDPRARRAAVMAVAQIGGVLANDILSFALADEERDVQLAAARALAHACSDTQAGRWLTEGPPSGSSPLSPVTSRARATDVLELLGRSGDDDLVAVAVNAFGEGMTTWAPPSLPPSSRGGRGPSDDLIAALAPLARKAPSAIAIAAVDALSRAPAGTPGTLPALIGALGHPDPAVIKAAMLKIEVSDDTAEKIARCLEHPSPGVRQLAAEKLTVSEHRGARERLARRAATELVVEVREAMERALAATPRRERGTPGL